MKKRVFYVDNVEPCERIKESNAFTTLNPPKGKRVGENEKVVVLSNADGKKSIEENGIIRSKHQTVLLFTCLSIIRAVDLGATNRAMKFINYPAKTLIKSSRSAFTLLVGIIMGKRGHSHSDFIMVAMLMSGLIIFLRADVTTDAIFHPYGLILLVSAF